MRTDIDPHTGWQLLCPVSEIVGDDHYYTPGTGKTVEWDVMGDPRNKAEVCPKCAEHT